MTAGYDDSDELPVGAAPLRGGGVRFRVWAPRRRRVLLVREDGAAHRHPIALEPGADGYFAACVDDAAAGTLYRFLLDDDGPFPDPASRFQPEGPHGPSQVVDPHAYPWRHHAWRSIPPDARVLYELHVGTFTPEGSWQAAAAQLGELADLGVTVIELMPVADFPGRFGWGYDGVNLFAPTRLYGTPDDFRGFIDAAHGHGLNVILDVVYNHLGPDGNHLGAFSEDYFTDRYETDWGLPFNVDGEASGPVREYLLANAVHWVREYRVDGFRFDATQSIFDAHTGTAHILQQLVAAARAAAAGRTLFMVGENEPQETLHARAPAQGGRGLDALWNDDWHHSANVALTGRKEAYYSDYLGAPQEFISAAKYGYLYQGQHYYWQKQRRGTPGFDLPHTAYINFLQNHDQLANSVRGERLHLLTSPGQYRAMTALLLLGPAIPLLFQGQEFGASAPFLYFADHEPELAAAVARGRRKFLAQFPSVALPAVQSQIDEPARHATFARCRLDFTERQRHAELYRLHRDLLRLRHADETLGVRCNAVDGAVVGGDAFVLRFFGSPPGAHADRLLLVNLGRELHYAPAPEPLLAPPEGCGWVQLWTSEDLRYGGLDHPEPETADGQWHVPGHCAVVLRPRPRAESEA